MNIFQELAKRPWLAEQGALDNLEAGSAYALPIQKIGLRIFLAVATVIFTLMVVLYSERMEFGDWAPFSDPWLLWVNTGMLMLSSVVLQWTTSMARQGDIVKVRIGLLVGGAYALAFIGGQFLVWQTIASSEFLGMANPAIGFFYLLTGMHIAHLAGGLVALGRSLFKVWSGKYDGTQMRMSVELCTTYWHYLMVVWLVLFGLLLFT